MNLFHSFAAVLLLAVSVFAQENTATFNQLKVVQVLDSLGADSSVYRKMITKNCSKEGVIIEWTTYSSLYGNRTMLRYGHKKLVPADSLESIALSFPQNRDVASVDLSFFDLNGNRTFHIVEKIKK